MASKLRSETSELDRDYIEHDDHCRQHAHTFRSSSNLALVKLPQDYIMDAAGGRQIFNLYGREMQLASHSCSARWKVAARTAPN